MPETMIERISRTLCAIEFQDPYHYWGDGPLVEAVDLHWQEYVDTAVSLLVVIREPTDKMVEQGLVRLPGVTPDQIRAAWHTMVDIAGNRDA